MNDSPNAIPGPVKPAAGPSVSDCMDQDVYCSPAPAFEIAELVRVSYHAVDVVIGLQVLQDLEQLLLVHDVYDIGRLGPDKASSTTERPPNRNRCSQSVINVVQGTLQHSRCPSDSTVDRNSKARSVEPGRNESRSTEANPNRHVRRCRWPDQRKNQSAE